MSSLYVIVNLVFAAANLKLPSDIVYTAPTGVPCVKCAPGTYFLRHCATENTNAKCELCEEGRYTSDYNIAEYCDLCKTTCESSSLVPVQQCTRSSNLICDCPSGQFNLFPHLDKGHAVCKEFGACEPGYGVLTKGSSTQNTTCTRCVWGKNFSSNTSAIDECQPCTHCGMLPVLSECTLTQDRKCDLKPSDVHIISPQDSGTTVLTREMVWILPIGALVVVGLSIWIWRTKKLCFKNQQSQEENKSNIDQSSVNVLYAAFNQPTTIGTNLDVPLPNNPASPTLLPQNPSTLLLSRPSERATCGPSINSTILKTIGDGLLQYGQWKHLIRELYEEAPGNINADMLIKEANANYPQDIREQIYQCLKPICNSGARPDIVIKVLLQNENNQLVDMLRKKYPDVFNAGPCESTV